MLLLLLLLQQRLPLLSVNPLPLCTRNIGVRILRSTGTRVLGPWWATSLLLLLHRLRHQTLRRGRRRGVEACEVGRKEIVCGVVIPAPLAFGLGPRLAQFRRDVRAGIKHELHDLIKEQAMLLIISVLGKAKIPTVPKRVHGAERKHLGPASSVCWIFECAPPSFEEAFGALYILAWQTKVGRHSHTSSLLSNCVRLSPYLMRASISISDRDMATHTLAGYTSIMKRHDSTMQPCNTTEENVKGNRGGIRRFQLPGGLTIVGHVESVLMCWYVWC